jgi:hypothetical protein
MFASHCTSKSLPGEFRTTAEKLFPPAGFGRGKGPSLEAAAAFAAVLGIGDDFKKLWDVHYSGQAMREFLEHFRNNLDLLIQKTWVEKTDEIRKEALQDKIPQLITIMEKEDYPEALKEFGDILEELSYLFFGDQSQKDDFAEYALRIDPQFGLFWWYGGQISGDRIWAGNIDRNIIFALLLLGICYLTDF